MSDVNPRLFATDFRGLFLYLIVAAEVPFLTSLARDLGFEFVPDMLEMIVTTADPNLTTGFLILLLAIITGLGLDITIEHVAERFIKDSEGNLREWFSRRTDYSASGWLEAQEWIWKSPGARREFEGLLFISRLGRDTAVIVFLGTLLSIGSVVVVGFRWTSLVSAIVSLGFAYSMARVWLDKMREYHRLVAAAGQIGSPRADN